MSADIGQGTRVSFPLRMPQRIPLGMTQRHLTPCQALSACVSLPLGMPLGHLTFDLASAAWSADMTDGHQPAPASCQKPGITCQLSVTQRKAVRGPRLYVSGALTVGQGMSDRQKFDRFRGRGAAALFYVIFQGLRRTTGNKSLARHRADSYD